MTVYLSSRDDGENSFLDSWPYDMGDPNMEKSMEIELLELQNDYELKPFRNQTYNEFWLQPAIPGKFPTLWGMAK